MRDIEDCRPYLAHLRMEHQHLHEVLAQIQASLAELCCCQQSREECARKFITGLCDLREELERHFAEEEEGGCLEEAESRCPSLAAEVKRVQAEHPLLSGQMNDVVSKAKELAGSPGRAAELAREFEQFAAKVRKHEAAENEIMLYGFGAEAMDEIMEDPNHVG